MKHLVLALFILIFSGPWALATDKSLANLKVESFDLDQTYYLGPDGKLELVDRRAESKPPLFIYPKVNPTGLNSRPLDSTKCDPEQLEAQLLQMNPIVASKNHPIKLFFKDCEKLLRKGAPRALTTLTSVEGLDYNIYRNPKISPIKIKMSNGEVVLGVLAMQDYKTPRPMIVIKCGIFCESSKNGAGRNLIMHLFDESPFNLMILGSHTSIENMKNNQRINFGGFYEGQELFTVGYWLRHDSPIKHLVSDLHSVGISLGGNAALFSSLYNDHNIPKSGKKVFDSVFAYCPAVNMKPTVQEVFKVSVKGILVSLQTWYTINSVYGHVPDLQPLIDLRRPVPIKGYPRVIAEASNKFLSRLNPRSFLNPFRGADFSSDTEAYWTINNFLNFSQNIETPLMVMASNDDSVVKYKLNTKPLKNHKSDNTTIIDLPLGEHCGLSFAYGWKVMSHIFRGHFLNMSPNYKHNFKRVLRPAQLPVPRLKSRESIANYEWKAHSEQDKVTLKYYIYRNKYKKQECYRNLALARHPQKFRNDSHCIRSEKFTLKLSDLPREGLSIPKGKVNTESLSRWMNSHLLLRDNTGRNVKSTSNKAKNLLVTLPY